MGGAYIISRLVAPQTTILRALAPPQDPMVFPPPTGEPLAGLRAPSVYLLNITPPGNSTERGKCAAGHRMLC